MRWKILISGERGPSSQLSTGIAEMTPGTLLPLHHHAPAETYYVISGHGYVTVDDHEASLGPEASIFIPANAKHSLRCTGTENLVFYSPLQRIGSMKSSTISMRSAQLPAVWKRH